MEEEELWRGRAARWPKSFWPALSTAPPQDLNQEARAESAVTIRTPRSVGGGIDRGEVDIGTQLVQVIPPGQFWRFSVVVQHPEYIRFNISHTHNALLGIYGRRNLPPTHTQTRGASDGNRECGALNNQSQASDMHGTTKTTVQTHKLELRLWRTGGSHPTYGFRRNIQTQYMLGIEADHLRPSHSLLFRLAPPHNRGRTTDFPFYSILSTLAITGNTKAGVPTPALTFKRRGNSSEFLTGPD
ncbi:hypothetical protein AOLI_G00272260 [Acnodon oligacanthus]